MKLYISKKLTDDGKLNFYTTIKNNYKNSESKMYIPLQLPKEKQNIEHGVYDVVFFLSCFTTKNGVRPKIVITKFI